MFSRKKILLLTIPLALGLFFFFAHNSSAVSMETLTGFKNPGTLAAYAVGKIVEFYVAAIGKLVVQLVHILIVVASYNEFVTSPAIANGWVIVRDVVNMFFIIILLVIAFATIFNVKEYKYQAMLPRLLIMAVVINFSRTIAGILIDFGQVVMLTFVNGFQAAAGGNFVNALRINELLAWNQVSLLAENADPNIGWIFIAYILAALMITVLLVVIVVMLMMLVMRIVVLWFLVVLSPMAFLSSVWPAGRIREKYALWWDMFLDNIMVGPLLAFFLWLSLLVLGSGTIGDEMSKQYAARVGGEALEIKPTVGHTKIGTPENMTSYLMGIGMLIGSLYMAQSMRSAGRGIAGAALGKMQGYASAGVKRVVALPTAAMKKGAGAVYEKTGLRANVAAIGTGIRTSKFGKFVGLGTKEYKDMEKAKREEKALRRFGQTTQADALRTRIVSAEKKKIEESGMTGDAIKARLDSKEVKKGSFEYEALALAAASKRVITKSRDFKKYAGDDRRMEELLRTTSSAAGNKKAFRGWAADPKKAVNEQKEAVDVYYQMSRGARQAAYSNALKGAELDENSQVTDEFAAVDISVIDPEDFENFSDKIQKGILDAIVLLEKNDPDKFKEFDLSKKFDQLAAKASDPAISGPGGIGTFAAYSATPQSEQLFEKQSMSMADKRLGAERAGTLVRSDIDKAVVQIFKNVVGREGAGTGVDKGREWQQGTLNRTYDIQNDISIIKTSADVLDVESKLMALLTRLENKADDMDIAGVMTGQIDKITGKKMSNVEVLLQSDLHKNLIAARDLGHTGSTDQKTRDAMAALLNMTARNIEPIAPRTATMSMRNITRQAVGRFQTMRGGAARAFDDAKDTTDMQKRLIAVKLAVKKAKDTTSVIIKNKKQFSQNILSEVDAINTKLESLALKGASVSNDDLTDAIRRLEELEKRIA